MTRFITAPLVGVLLGAIEAGILFTILTVIDTRQGAYAGINNELIYVSVVVGIVLGGILGGLIGLIVALMNAGSIRGLLLGSLIGLAFAIFIFIRIGPLDDAWTIVAITVVPGGASTGLVSALLTGRHRQAQPSAEPRKSHRILS